MIKMTCKYCGSDEISRDACVIWDIADQRWEITNLYDNFYCRACENDAGWCEEVKIKEEPA